MFTDPEVRFAPSPGGRIAYEVVGDGPVNILVSKAAWFPIDLMWDEPALVRFLEGMSGFSRHVWFDARGLGASDRPPGNEVRVLEAHADDMLAVLDDLGWEEAVVLGLGAATPVLFAAGHPERTKALVLVNVTTGIPLEAGASEQRDDEANEERLALVEAGFGTGAALELFAPSAAGDQRLRRWLARSERLLGTKDDHAWRTRNIVSTDLRGVLGTIGVPTLGLYRTGLPRADAARQMIDEIPGSKAVELPGSDMLFFAGETGPILDAIEDFVTGELPTHTADRVLATVVFTDLVGSTAHALGVGDRRWTEMLASHDRLVADEIERHRGRRVKSTGDGVLAVFDGPARAVRCACAIRDGVRSLGMQARAGVHTGEIELRGDDVGGIGVHLAARVSALAEPGEVLVSRTVTELVVGSGIEFVDRGDHQLKGIPASWRLSAVRA